MTLEIRTNQNARWANYTYTYRNHSSKPIIIMFADFWNNHKIVVDDARGVELPLSVKGLEFRKALTEKWGNRDHNLQYEIPPGGSYTAKAHWDVSELYSLAPGRYLLRLTYYERMRYPLMIDSNSLPIVVESAGASRNDAVVSPCRKRSR